MSAAQKRVLEGAGLAPDDLALRERAAYVLDKAYDGFSGVPPTALVKVHDKDGALQEFVRNEGCAEDNPSLVAKASVLAVQRVGVLDCRIFNMDRHGGNVLIRTRSASATTPTGGSRARTPNSRSGSQGSSGVGGGAARTPSRSESVNGGGGGSLLLARSSSAAGDDTFEIGAAEAATAELGLVDVVGDGDNNEEEDDEDDGPFTATTTTIDLVPIDHALTLPSWVHLDGAWFDWSWWPQAREPLLPETLAHIARLDADRDAEMLRDLGVSESCVATMKLCTIVLKEFASRLEGCTLKTLADVFGRPYAVGHRLHDQVLSPLEHFVEEACMRCGGFVRADGNGEPPPAFYATLQAVVREEIETGHFRTLIA